MNEIKKLDKKQMTQNVCSLLVKSGEPFESIALYLGISDRLIYYWQEGKRSPTVSSWAHDLPSSSLAIRFTSISETYAFLER